MTTKIGILIFTCFDPRYDLDVLAANSCEKLGFTRKVDCFTLVQTLPGGNYRPDLKGLLEDALKVATLKQWEIRAVMLARHARNDCGACEAGVRHDRDCAIPAIYADLRLLGVEVPVYTLKVSTAEGHPVTSFRIATEKPIPVGALI